MGALLNRRRYMGGVKEQGHNLPAEYQEVKYIENVGGATTGGNTAFETGFKFNFNAYTFECVFSMDSPPQYNQQAVFGTRFSNNQQFSFIYEKAGSQGLNFNFSNKGVYAASTSFDSDIHTFKYIGGPSAQEWWFDGVLKNSWNYTDLPSTTTFQLVLFALTTYYSFRGKVYYLCLKESSDSTLKFEYIPCYRKSDSMPGFYDLATNTFKTITDADQYWSCGTNVN